MGYNVSHFLINDFNDDAKTAACGQWPVKNGTYTPENTSCLRCKPAARKEAKRNRHEFLRGLSFDEIKALPVWSGIGF